MKILKFGKKGCSPCDQVEKLLKESGIQYDSINAAETEDVDLLIEHGIRNVPVTILFNNDGEVLQKEVGFNEENLKKLINVYKNV